MRGAGFAERAHTVPGVYRVLRPRSAEFSRVRTDVAGFVGVAGAVRLEQAVRLDDWRSYELTFLRDADGRAVPPPPGSRLSETVRAFFANGGSRCWVVNVAASLGAVSPEQLLDQMLGRGDGGVRGTSPRPSAREGLECLLAEPEVSLVALPELDATLERDVSRADEDLPPLFEAGRFRPCSELAPAGSCRPPASMSPVPLFGEPQILAAQRYLLERCGEERWRVFALLAPPAGKTVAQALAWRRDLGRAARHLGAWRAAGALYWPWLWSQVVPGAPLRLSSPIGHVAGVFARRDLAQGPHVAPANEVVFDVVGPEYGIEDEQHGELYDAGLNVLRSFAGAGVKLWGARTLLWESPASAADAGGLQFVNVRRCLSAIERTAASIGERAMFEPNLPLLRLQLSQALVGYLLAVFRSGALAGTRPEQSFYVRCDESFNTPDVLAAGQVICEVGVAIAAPAEFIVFRLGRKEGVVEIQETL